MSQITISEVKAHFPNLEWIKHNQIFQLLAGEFPPESFEDVQRWCAQCYNPPSSNEMVMCALNQILSGHGVEAITHESEILGTYVNMGDTYDATVVWSEDTRDYILTDWGTFYESEEQRLKEEAELYGDNDDDEEDEEDEEI